MVAAVTVWVPVLLGGEYKPVLVIVPDEGEPPTIPSTDQVALLVAVNCSVISGVTTAVRGVTPNPEPVPDTLIVWGLPGALSLISTDALRTPVSVGVNVMLIVHVPFGATVDPQVFV